jgi:hypothetical protein
MNSLIKYSLDNYMRSHRYFPPAAAYLILVVLCYSAPRPMPVGSSHAFTAMITFVVAGWFCLTLHNVEDPVQSQITLIHAKNFRRVLHAKFVSVFFLMIPFIIFSLLLPLVIGAYGRMPTSTEFLIGAAVHLLMALLGDSIGCHFIDELVRPMSRAWGGLALVWAISLSGKGLEDFVFTGLKWVAWVLPPAPLAMDLLMGDDYVSPVLLIWILIYIAILYCLYIKRMTRRDI